MTWALPMPQLRAQNSLHAMFAEIIDEGRTHGPFCDTCAQSAAGIPFDQ